MFSGIVKAVGKVESVMEQGSSNRMVITSDISGALTIDQSVSHNGVCLTIVKVHNGMHEVDIVAETLSKTTFQSIQKGDFINLERSITPSTLLDGHLVQGHVDTILKCMEIRNNHGSWNMVFSLPHEYAGLVIPHGSICLNGVSLTVANLFPDHFEVAIIPFTFENTNFKNLREGEYVNVEFDLIGKYILRQAELRKSK
jgi:riboflavin synthase